MNTLVNYDTDARTPRERLFETFGNPKEEVVLEAAKRSEETRVAAKEYDASKYVWRSDGHVGNTLVEIEEIKVHGHPLPKSREAGLGDMKYRGFTYEGTDGFLKGSQPATEAKPSDDEAVDEINFLYAEPLQVQEKFLNDRGYSEVVHNQYGRGFLLDTSDSLSRVYFMQLPGSTPSCHHGANIRWVKTSNLL